jgi:hypothetical protein
MRPRKVHIVEYNCEHCGAGQTRRAGVHNDGMCSACGFPMRIADLFGDRRIVTLPVTFDRRSLPPEERAA